MPTFSLLTFNCLGAPGIGARRRLLTLARELEGAPYDVVCLQEVQSQIYRKLLVGACASYTSVYAPYFYAPRGGLLTLARRPITSNQFTKYQDRGLVHTPAVVDRPLNKGVLRTSLALGDLAVVVLNTHLNANYRGDWSAGNHFARTERAQLGELAQIVNAQPASTLVLVAGDFNIPRGTWLYDEFMALSGLDDPLAADPRPTYRPYFFIPKRFALAFDYALVRAPPLPGFQVQADLRFHEQLDLVDGRRGYLSDHYAVELRLSWAAQSSEDGGLDRPQDQGAGLAREAGAEE